jgi:hypothetical protein
MTKPNLFSYATSELSQDAVLCWLLAWAAPEAARHDPHLGRLGRALVEAMFAKHEKVTPEVHKMEVTRQYKNIDVLARINDALWLVIEDKVYTREHSDQLRRYLEVLDQEREPHQTLLTIYVQTGEQSSHAAVTGEGFRVFGRSDFLAVLYAGVGDGCRSEIVTDFREHLQRIDDDVKRYREGIAGKWSGLTWQGFFGALQDALKKGIGSTSRTRPVDSRGSTGTAVRREMRIRSCNWRRLASASRSIHPHRRSAET